jgi:uncharacterized cupredoxin-like copper-binding protein
MYTMMKKVFATCFVLLFAVGGLFAQNNLIKFNNETHDFGNLKEEGGNPEHEFEFTNTSTKPVQLVYVKASCGCTTPTWTKEVVAPGAKGSIKASYNVKPGAFNKTISVRATTADNVDKEGNAVDNNLVDTKVLTIKGDIAARPKGIADFYPFEDGSLRYTTNHVAFGTTQPGKQKTQSMKIYNQGEKDVTLQTITLPTHIRLSIANGTVVKAKDSVQVTVTYDASKINDWDFIHDNVTIETNDSDRPQKRLYVSAKIEEDFSAMTEAQKANAAHIRFAEESHDFGKIGATTPVTHKFAFTNTGKSELLIRKVKASCGCTAPTPTKTTLAPGESSEIVVTFNPSGKSGEQQKSITVVTNDPDKSVINLVIKSNIEKEGAESEEGHSNHDGHSH